MLKGADGSQDIRLNQSSKSMKISQLAVDRLLKINWLSEIGKEFTVSNMVLAKSLNETEHYLATSEWENVTLEESNKISGYLAVRHTVIFQEWNELAKKAKSFFINDIIFRIPHLSGFNNTLLHQCLEWNIVHYLIEDTYRGKLTKPLFFSELIPIYEAGHMPCGWVGNWPSGQLVVY
ncbi:MAG: hypothetical protein MESAZ_01976 [Saezia sanguinis]